MRFRRRPGSEIVAAQFLVGQPIPKGVCFEWACDGPVNDHPHVHTIHDGQRVEIVFGDWVVAEPDGRHYYLIKADIFEATYEPAEPKPQEPPPVPVSEEPPETPPWNSSSEAGGAAPQEPK
jgi:hypothetical protein